MTPVLQLGDQIKGRPSRGGYETGWLLGFRFIKGQQAAHVMWDRPRPGAKFGTSGTDWLDTVPLSAVAVREVAA